MLDDAELLELLRDLESDRSERKANASDMTKLRRAVCAFANDLPGHGQPGVLFVGVRDNGVCENISVSDELLKSLAAIRSHGDILPVPSIQVEKRILDGCELAVVQVEPSGAPPVRFRGRVWVRVGPTTPEASREDERVLTERARSANQPFDRRPAFAATIDDLDVDYFASEYLPSAVAKDVLEENQRTASEQLASLRFLVDGVPTNGGLVVVGKDPRAFIPGAYVQFLRIDGLELGDPIKDQKELTGPLAQVVRQLDELLELSVSTATEIAGSREEARPDYPIEALRQFARNALIHRNYETSNAPVRVYWFNDRVEIHNPGGLFGQVTPDNFGKGATDYRNPLIAEAMATLGYVQRFGYGVPLARKYLEKNSNPDPEFDFQQSAVLVSLRSRP